MNKESGGIVRTKKDGHQAQGVCRKKGKNRNVSKNTVTPSRLGSGTNVHTAVVRRRKRAAELKK